MGFYLTDSVPAPTATSRPSFLPSRSRLASPNPHRGPKFTSVLSTKYTDDETGLVMYQLRAYSPGLGRFISRDPIGEEGGLNAYAFCLNSAIGAVDILGLDTLLLILGEEFTSHSDVFRRTGEQYVSQFKEAGYCPEKDAIVTVDLSGTGENAVKIVQAAFERTRSIRIVGYIGHSAERNLFLTAQPSPGSNLGVLDVDKNRNADDPERLYYATSFTHLDLRNLTRNAYFGLLSCHAGDVLAPAIAKTTKRSVLATPSKVNFSASGKAFVRMYRAIFTGGWKWYGGIPKRNPRDEDWSQAEARDVQKYLDLLIRSYQVHW